MTTSGHLSRERQEPDGVLLESEGPGPPSVGATDPASVIWLAAPPVVRTPHRHQAQGIRRRLYRFHGVPVSASSSGSRAAATRSDDRSSSIACGAMPNDHRSAAASATAVSSRDRVPHVVQTTE